MTKALAKAGSWVTVLQRSDKFRKDIEELGAMLNIGDVLNPSTIEKALRLNTFDAVVCTVGKSLKLIGNLTFKAETKKDQHFIMGF